MMRYSHDFDLFFENSVDHIERVLEQHETAAIGFCERVTFRSL
jgi:hypothetical protein